MFQFDYTKDYESESKFVIPTDDKDFKESGDKA
jgi:hypothetical protein